MTKKWSETAIRDYIAARLDLIEPGLTFVDKEFYLKNSNGASGFLDIFARSATGQLVIIEIKKTNSAAREAIQELYKYAALLRERYLIQDIEYRLILLSVEWHELLTPYSEFVQTAPYEVLAGRIILNDTGVPDAIEPVAPIPPPAGRKIGIRHFLWRFPSEADARAAVPKLAKFMTNAGLTDFVLVESRSSNPLIADNGFLYFAQQELTLDAYMALIECNLSDAQLEEFRENIASLPELEDRVAEASDAVWAYRSGTPYCEIGSDSAEISNPEKARAWFEPGKQISVQVHRFGRFADDSLSDDMIIAEIVGDGGESDFRLRFTARTDSPPRMKALKEKVENIFFNPEWLGAVTQLITYATRKNRPATIDIVAFSNEDVLRGIAGAAFGYPGYVPTFRLDIIHDDKIEQFIGLIEWDGSTPDFDKIIADHFSGDRFGYFMAAHFGENRGMNLDIMNTLGLRYSVFREGLNGPERIRVQGSTIIAIGKPIRGSINTMIHENIEEVSKIVELFMEHDMGFAKSIESYLNSELPTAERQLADLVSLSPRPDGVTFWSGDITVCNNCGYPFASLRFMVDTILLGGIGTNLCAKCFFDIGRGLGTGRGQAYEATEKGWLHVAG